MAEATLADVTKTLKENQRKTDDGQASVAQSIDDLTDKFDRYLQYLKSGDKLEAKIEATKAKKSSGGTSSSQSLADTFSDFIPNFLKTFAFGLGGFALGLEGLGPNAKDLKVFRSALTRYTRFITAFPRALARIAEKFPTLNLEKPLSGFLNRLRSLRLNVLKFFGIGADGRNIPIRGADGAFRRPGKLREAIRDIIRLATRITNFFSRLQIPAGLSKALTAANDFFKGTGSALASGARGGAGALLNSGLVRGLIRFLRPIAAIFSAFDGIENATAEMEDREGYFNKILGGGIGGFASGFLGSFFGELFNLVKDAPLWIIKKFVPADWLNEDGTFDTSENIFTKVLGGLEMLDFNKMIREIVQAPFDVAGRALDFVRNLFGATGTTEEGQAEARASWNEWWSNWKSLNGIASNVGGVLSFVINTAFRPLDIVLRNIMEAFGADPELTDSTDSFIDRIKKIVDYVFGLIPSVEEIKTKIASMLSPKVATAIGLGDYLPMTQENFNERAARFLVDEQELEGRIANQLDIIKNLSGRDNLTAMEGYTLESARDYLPAAQAQYEELKREYDEFRSRAIAGGISETVINNNSPTFETNYFPAASSTDANDREPLRLTITR